MLEICRHVLTSGLLCSQVAVRGTNFCRHHGVVKSTMAECHKPTPYGVYMPLPFVMTEDFESIQLNLFVVIQALNEQRIDVKMANAFNRLLRNSQLNLTSKKRAEAEARKRGDQAEQTVTRVILTPEGEEIGLPRERLEPGEKPLVHHERCLCRRCAEEFRGAEPEQHHADCKCGVCDDPVEDEAGDDAVSNDAVSSEAGSGGAVGDGAVRGDAVSDEAASVEPKVISQPATQPGAESTAQPLATAMQPEAMPGVVYAMQSGAESATSPLAQPLAEVRAESAMQPEAQPEIRAGEWPRGTLSPVACPGGNADPSGLKTGAENAAHCAFGCARACGSEVAPAEHRNSWQG